MATKKVKYEDNLAPEVRRLSIGGSDSATILGANKYKSKVELWMEITGLKERVDLSENEFIYWGNTLEEVVAKEFTVRTGKKVKRNNFVLYHLTIPYLSANLDREIVGERSFLECKTTNAYNWKEWEGTNIPLSYIYQVMHYLIVTGYEYGYIAVLIGGNKYVWKRIDRDEELIAMMLKAYAEFWHCVETNTIPEVKDFSNLNNETVKALYPESKAGTSIQLPYSEITVENILQYKKMIKDYQETLDSFENELKMELQDNEMATVGDKYIVTYKTIESERFDSKKLKQEMPEVASKYIKTSSYRKLSIKEIGE